MKCKPWAESLAACESHMNLECELEANAARKPWIREGLNREAQPWIRHFFGRKKAHKHKLFALVNFQMALGQTVGCPRGNRAKKFMCSPRNTGNINFSLWLTGGLSQGCPDFQKVYVFKVYVPFSCPNFQPPKFQCFNSQCALHGSCALEFMLP